MSGRASDPELVARWAGRKVVRRSTLGKALELQDRIGDKLKPYRDVLEKIAQYPNSESAFEAVVRRHRNSPNSERLPEALLHQVIMAALSSDLARTPTAEERDYRRERNLPEPLSVAQHRTKIEERFKTMFEALDSLDRGLATVSNLSGIQQSIVCEVTEEDTNEPLSTTYDECRPEGLRNDGASLPPPTSETYVTVSNHDVMSAVAGFAMALGHEEAISANPAAVFWRERLLYMSKIPSILGQLRAFLEDQKRRDLGALEMYPTGRNQGQEPDRKAFTIMLSRNVERLLSVHDHQFVCDMLDVIFPSEKNYEVAAVARLVQLDIDRRMKHRDAGAGSSEDEKQPGLR